MLKRKQSVSKDEFKRIRANKDVYLAKAAAIMRRYTREEKKRLLEMALAFYRSRSIVGIDVRHFPPEMISTFSDYIDAMFQRVGFIEMDDIFFCLQYKDWEGHQSLPDCQDVIDALDDIWLKSGDYGWVARETQILIRTLKKELVVKPADLLLILCIPCSVDRLRGAIPLTVELIREVSRFLYHF